VYEERYESLTKETPIRIAETLVNKRIFSLARPLWYRHLSISDSQLDLRLAGLHMHDGRRTVLRHLRVSLANAHFNLFKSVLLRLPLLTHLTLQVPEDLAPEALSEVVAGIARLDGLKHLTLESPDQCENLTQMWKEFHRIKPGGLTRFSLAQAGELYHELVRSRVANLRCMCYDHPGSQLFPVSSWQLLFSLELRGSSTHLEWDDRIMKSLRKAVANDVCSNLFCLAYDC